MYTIAVSIGSKQALREEAPKVQKIEWNLQQTESYSRELLQSHDSHGSYEQTRSDGMKNSSGVVPDYTLIFLLRMHQLQMSSRGSLSHFEKSLWISKRQSDLYAVFLC